MYAHQWFLVAFLAFFVLHLSVETLLSVLNGRYLRARRGELPAALRGAYTQEEYDRSISYALARTRLGHVDRCVGAACTVFFLFTGFIPMLDFGVSCLGLDELSHAVGVLLLFILVAAALNVPLELYAVFGLEARYGFNQMTLGTWCCDKLKAFLLLLVLGVPFLYALSALITRAGPFWWLWAGLFVVAFQMLITVLYPVFIAPLFNKFTPLEDGELKTQLEALTRQCGFAMRGVLVMDGSTRSTHSNAYFTGVGRARRIALYDTLIRQLSTAELVAVLAHEIGHYKRKHILKLLALSAVLTLLGSYILSLLLYWDPLYQAFSLGLKSEPKGLIVLSLVAMHFTFWAGPLLHRLSRKHEYEADAYAAEAGGAAPMQSALLKIHARNLAAPLPHPAYSAFYYSHPTLLERVEALKGTGPA